jgi:hypothetical protein
LDQSALRFARRELPPLPIAFPVDDDGGGAAGEGG